MLNKLKNNLAPILLVLTFAVPITLAALIPSSPQMPPEVVSMYHQHGRIQTYITKVQPSAPANRIAMAIVTNAKECKVDPYLVTSLMHTESNFRVDAESETGARGLMQIVQSTFKSLGGEWAMAYDIELNVAKGSCYLARHIHTYNGRVDLALKRYNGNDDPRFARKVLSKLRTLSDLHKYEIVVKKGDTLAGIAETYLGDAGMYPLLAEYNDISNPNLIEVGQRIIIVGG